MFVSIIPQYTVSDGIEMSRNSFEEKKHFYDLRIYKGSIQTYFVRQNFFHCQRNGKPNGCMQKTQDQQQTDKILQQKCKTKLQKYARKQNFCFKNCSFFLTRLGALYHSVTSAIYKATKILNFIYSTYDLFEN